MKHQNTKDKKILKAAGKKRDCIKRNDNWNWQEVFNSSSESQKMKSYLQNFEKKKNTKRLARLLYPV